MKGEFTVFIEKSTEGGFWAVCPEVPGASGQGKTIEETKENLKKAVSVIIQAHLEGIKRGLPDDAIEDTFPIG